MTNTSPTERRAKAEGAIEALRAAAEEMHVGIGVGAIPFEVRPAIKSWLRRLAEQRLDRSRRESAEPAAAPAVVEPPTTWPAEPVREQLLRAIDFNYVASLGYSGPEELLAAYDTSRTPTDQTAPVCRDAEGCHRVVPCDPGCGARDLLAEATRPRTQPADRAAVLRWAADRAYQIARRLDEQEHDERAQGAWDVENTLRAELRRMADETATTEGYRLDPADEALENAMAAGAYDEPAVGARQDGATS